MKTINPYLAFNGNAEEAFTFYKSVFGGEFTKIVRFKDLPGDPNHPIAESEAHYIMYIGLPIGESNFLLANDVPSSMGVVNEKENRSKLLLNTESKEEADRIFHSLSAGGTVEFPIGDSPWGSYFGMFRDKYGIEWMIEFDSKNS
ncbi:VOC family protein [Candidatus Woesearchaeota archaeon]|nr:VOC family protein [Candidatus Woesearchaeota archaeon]USN44171.1 MAG: VOC family protein [Candidatus Woesearchaeota archaeon]